jgi:FkbM family methyltransferase
MSRLTAALRPFLVAALPPAHVEGLTWLHHYRGAPAALRSYAGLLARRDGLLAVSAPELRHRVHLRPGTTDPIVFDQVFHEREYDLDLGTPQTIVDAGANVGFAAALFASRYPETRILAVEPEGTNVALLRRNTAPYANVMTVQAGLWSRPARLAIENPDGEPWGFRVVETDAASGIPALDVPEAMRRLGTDHLDVLKLDIEGSECAVLGSADAWIDRVGTIIVELHPWAQPCGEDLVRHLVERHGFRRSQRGENVVLRRD